jgi:hypothetical protein
VAEGERSSGSSETAVQPSDPRDALGETPGPVDGSQSRKSNSLDGKQVEEHNDHVEAGER